MSAGPDRPPAERRYSSEQFDFVDEEAGAEVSGWLHFMNSRSGRRADRRERRRERLLLLGVVLAILGVVAVALLWRPWGTDGPAADTGHDALGADRVTVLMQVQGTTGAAVSTAILQHDRRDDGSGALVVVPDEMVLPVEGEGRQTVGAALAAAGPTLSREAVGELLGLQFAGSWLLDVREFSSLVDRLGGIRVAGSRLDGAAAAERLATAEVAGDTLAGLMAGFPGAFSAGADLLTDFGILASPGLPVERLAAVLSGLARDGAAQRLDRAALPLDGSGQGLDVPAALPIVRDTLGGEPGGGRGDATPRIAVSISPGAGVEEFDVRADILNAGYEYVAGAQPAADAPTSVTVRPSVPDAAALGESIAATLGLAGEVVQVADDVPFIADVAVVLGGAG